jgi:hypothetical protein
MLKTSASIAMIFVAFLGCGPGPEQDEAQDLSTVASKLVVPGATSLAITAVGGPDPGVVYFLGQPHITFTGTDFSVNVIRRLPNGSWDTPTVFAGRGVTGSSLLVFGGSLVLAYYDADRNFQVWQSLDGKNFQRTAYLDIGTISNGQNAYGEPALAVHGGLLQVYIAFGPIEQTVANWHAAGHIRQLLRNTDGNWFWGTDWPAETKDISVAVVNGDLHVVWNDRGFTRRYRRSYIVAQGQWSSVGFEDVFTQGRAFAAPDSGGVQRLWWAGRSSIDNSISFTGLDFSMSPITTGHTSDRSPFGVVNGSNHVEWTHVGTDGDRSINFNSI